MALTQKRLMEVLHYDPLVGLFTWTNIAPFKVRGKTAGSFDAKGYWVIRVDDTCHKAHRLAWLYMTGEWPQSQIDHINQQKADNRFANLRVATNAQNMWNIGCPKTNTSGLKGVDLLRGKWRAQISFNGEKRHIGVFDCPTSAHFAYLREAKKLYGQFANAGS